MTESTPSSAPIGYESSTGYPAEGFDPDQTVRGDAATVPLMPVVKDEVVEAPSVAFDKTVPLMQAVSERAPSAVLKAVVDAGASARPKIDAVVDEANEWQAIVDAQRTELHDYNSRLNRACAFLRKLSAYAGDLRAANKSASADLTKLNEDYAAVQDDLAALDEEFISKTAECDALDECLADTAQKLAASEGQGILLADNLAAKTAEYDGLKADWNVCRLGKVAVIEFLRKRRPEYLARLADHSDIEVPEGKGIVTVLYDDDVVFYSALIGLFEEDTKERGALQARVESLQTDVRTVVQERDALKTKAADLEEQMAVDSKYAREKAVELLAMYDAAFECLGRLKEE